MTIHDDMTPADFRTERRQKYLNLEYYLLNQKNLEAGISIEMELMQREKKGETDSKPTGARGAFKDRLDLLKLHYTAGVPVAGLQPHYDKVMVALKGWQEADLEYTLQLEKEFGEMRRDVTPLYFEALETFQPAMDMLSLGLLLGDGEALRQLAYWFRHYRHGDILFEELISSAISDPDSTCEAFFHEQPYIHLIHAFFADNQEAATVAMEKYLGCWYKSFEDVPWHNGHLYAVPGEYMPYYGYWSFEAAAICVLHDIDDRKFRNHILYPKDLADWARKNKSIEKVRPSLKAEPTAVPAEEPSLYVHAGNPCPRAGWWWTPANAKARRHFALGEIMPEVTSSTHGSTLWHWDQNQSE